MLLSSVAALHAQQTPEVFEDDSQTAAARGDIQKLPLGDLDTTVIVPAADTLPAPQKTLKKGFALGGTQDDLFEEKVPQGTLAVYINIEEAFNKHPATLQARRTMRLDLEAKQIEYAQIQQQVKELRAKQQNLTEEIEHYKPFYEPLQYIDAPGANIYPRLQNDKTDDLLTSLVFGQSAVRVASPENTPQKLDQIKESIKDAKKTIIEKESFLLNYKELSREEVLSRQDYIVQQVLKEIYTGIKEYAQIRNIGLIVDKKDLIYGQPLDVTNEFIKWMNNYHKKYVKENGDIL